MDKPGNGFGRTATGKSLHWLIVVCLLSVGATGAADDDSAPEADPMVALRFLVGNWSGAGWHDHGGGKVNEFDQTLVVESWLGGDVLVSEQKAILSSDATRVLHHSATIYRFDAESGQVVAENLRDGRRRVTPIEPGEGRIEWPARGDSQRWSLERTEHGLLQRGRFAESGALFFELSLQPAGIVE